MYSINDLNFWISFVVFFVAIFFSFYLPGLQFIKFIDRKISLRNIVLSYCTGFVMWTVQGYIFAFLNIRWATYLYLLLVLLLSYYDLEKIKNDQIYLIQRIKKNKIISFSILFGMILQSLLMFGSGFLTKEGISFLGSNEVDGVMHLSYIQSMITKFPPIEPGAYHQPLRNYHYWIDLNIAELARIWRIPVIHIFFQFLPIFISIITGISTFLLMRIWTKSKKAGLWALFFLYFGGDGAYLFMLYFQKKFGFYTPAIDNGITQFLNMPHAAAKMIFIVSLIPFFYWIKTKQKKWGILTVFLFSSLVGFKIYFGIFAGLGLGFVVAGKVFFAIYKNKNYKERISSIRKEYFSFAILILFLLTALAIYLPSNSSSGGLLYYPLEWPKLFLGENNLNVREWWLRMQVYEEAHNLRNIIIYDAWAILVTLVCVHGTRILGIIPHKKLYKLLGWEHILFFMPGIVVFHFLGLFTLQAAGSFNVFNFFVVSTVIMSFFSAYLMYELSSKNKLWSNVLVILVVILTLPRPIYEIYSATSSIIKNNGAKISKSELDAASYIRQNTETNAVIQTHPQNVLDSRTPYISFLTNRQTYLTGITMIESHGQKIKPLEDELKYLFSLNDPTEFLKRAKLDNINYIYLQKTQVQKLPFSIDSAKISKVYENENIIVLKLN